MKINRYKKASKHLNFYVVNFGFHKPFQVLIDGTFCYAALQNRVQIKEDLPKYLGGDVKLLTTQCVVLETEKLGPNVRGAMQIAKSFGIHRCKHGKHPVSGAACFMTMISNNNQNRYIIATQDPDLQTKVQNVPSVPLIYFNRSSTVLQPPSEKSLQAANKNKETALGLTEYQGKVLTTLKHQILGCNHKENKEVSSDMPRKRKGPNPLSCKKKRKLNEHLIETNTDNTKYKRKRKRVKLSKHIKEELYNKTV